MNPFTDLRHWFGPSTKNFFFLNYESDSIFKNEMGFCLSKENVQRKIIDFSDLEIIIKSYQDFDTFKNNFD